MALQTAAEEPRVSTVVAAETFSDLRTIARYRAPFFLTEETIRKAFDLASLAGDVWQEIEAWIDNAVGS